MEARTNFAAEGRGYTAAARRLEERGEIERAKEFYLKAAGSYLEGYKKSNKTKEDELLMNFAENSYNKAMSLKRKKRKEVVYREKEDEYRKEREDDEDIVEVVPIKKPDIDFSDVAGLDDVKDKIKKAIVYPFKFPDYYKKYGKKSGGGILLYGPPGCGKTLIAKAAAGECEAAFIYQKGSEILSKWVGGSEKAIKAIYDAAAENAPSIVFFDEIDGIASARSDADANYEKRLVNTLLEILDGVEGREKVLTMAGTNIPMVIDPALRRPGRFDNLIYVPAPDLQARKEIFRIEAKKRYVDNDIDYGKLAKITKGYSCADIVKVCNDAADIPLSELIDSVDKGKEKISQRKINMNDFKKAINTSQSSLPPWYRKTYEQIKKSGEEDIFKEFIYDMKKNLGEK